MITFKHFYKADNFINYLAILLWQGWKIFWSPRQLISFLLSLRIGLFLYNLVKSHISSFFKRDKSHQYIVSPSLNKITCLNTTPCLSSGCCRSKPIKSPLRLTVTINADVAGVKVYLWLFRLLGSVNVDVGMNMTPTG